MAKEHNYTALRNELDEIMATLQSSSLDIDEATQLHDRAHTIIDQLEEYLDTAENEITKIEKQSTPKKKSS